MFVVFQVEVWVSWGFSGSVRCVGVAMDRWMGVGCVCTCTSDMLCSFG